MRQPCLFGIDDSRVCRIIQKLEPLVAKEMSLTKTQHLSQEEVEKLIIDATEQSIERPKKHQKIYYSGKKKRHILKTQLVVDKKTKKIICTSFSNGKRHDFKLFKESRVRIHSKTKCLTDTGYQGMQKIHHNSKVPNKKTKKAPLNKEDKKNNRELSSQRVLNENVIGRVKRFKIISDRYRNRRKRFALCFNLIAGIYNFEI